MFCLISNLNLYNNYKSFFHNSFEIPYLKRGHDLLPLITNTSFAALQRFHNNAEVEDFLRKRGVGEPVIKGLADEKVYYLIVFIVWKKIITRVHKFPDPGTTTRSVFPGVYSSNNYMFFNCVSYP